jgi:CDP-glycerol glycerophosphotransferase (TagB/SpsB family)
VHEIGYPRYDKYFDSLKNKELKYSLLKKHSCNYKKPTILWICTVSPFFSTIEKYAELMYQFTEKFNVILRPHPMEIDPQYDRYKKNVHDIVNSGRFIISNDPYQEMSDLYLIADFVFCDYGGSIFSALYVNKKIILMDHNHVRMDLEVYGSTSMEVREYLPTINKIKGCDIDRQILDSGFWNNGSENKKKARQKYFGNHEGNSANKAALRIMEIISYE